MNRQFLPFLTDDQGKSLAVENGVVVTKAIPDPLDNSPEGWEKSTIQFARNNEFRGVIKSFTTTLKFLFEGAKILRTYFYTKGVEAVLYFIWLKQNVSFGGGMKYEGWYKGEPDLSTFNDTYEGVEVNITEGGFFKELQANKNIPYEIPFDDNAVSLEMDGLEIFNKLKYTIAPEVIYEGSGGKTIAMSLISEEGTNSTLEVSSQPFAPQDLNSENWMLKNGSSSNQEIHITGIIRFMAPENGTLPLSFARMKFLKNTSDSNFNGWSFYSGNPPANQIFEKAIDYTITLAPDERLFLLQAQDSVNYDLFNIVFLEDSYLNVDFASRKETTVIKAYKSYDVGNILCNKMSNGKSKLNSDLLSNDYNLLITSGDAIRGIEGAVIKTKFSDFHKSIDAVKCISFGVQNNHGKLEERTYAFSNAQISNLGESRNFKLEPANDFRYNKIEVGYPAKDIEDLNGKYSFNNSVVYKTPVLRGGENTYDAKSVYYADPFIIEIIRINLEFKTTTDNKSDNDVFFIDAEKAFNNYIGEANFTIINTLPYIVLNSVGLNLKPGVRFKVLSGQNNITFTIVVVFEFLFKTYILVKESIVEEVVNIEIEFLHYKLRRLPYNSIEGIPNGDTVFNVELSPKRILNNHYRWIASAMDKLEAGMLVYQTTEKNSELVTTDANNVVIKEKEDIPIALLGPKIYLPYYLNFEVESPINLVELVAANPGGYFNTTVSGIGYKGYIIEVKTNEATLETQEYKLLATADNDFTKLINIR